MSDPDTPTIGTTADPPTEANIDPETAYRQGRDTAHAEAIRVLTTAARLRHPQYGRLDFAEFIADVLASVAANLGGVEQLLTGRSGSWEAGYVRDFLHSTVGHDEVHLVARRTEPIVIHLNVNQLMEERVAGPDFNTPYEAEIEEIERRYVEMYDAEAYDEDTQARHFSELDAAQARWAGAYGVYAVAFTAAVQDEAARIEGLSVPVTVEANTDPGAGGDLTPPHPDAFTDDDFDPIVWQLWEHAITTLPFPTTEDAS